MDPGLVMNLDMDLYMDLDMDNIKKKYEEKNMSEELTIDGKIYVLKEERTGGFPYVIIRSKDAGVFAGFLVKEEGDTVVLKDSRRLWYWDGAASLSQLAVDGVSKPQNCKFPVELATHKIMGVIEIIPTTVKAQKNIAAVPIWKF